MKKILILFLTFVLTHSALATPSSATSSEPVQKRIEELHSKLKITVDQETLWKSVVQEMIDSEKNIREQNSTREKNTSTMSAIEDLQSYANLASLHADALKKFIVAFTPLYQAMDAAQKKNADEVFRAHKEIKRKKKK